MACSGCRAPEGVIGRGGGAGEPAARVGVQAGDVLLAIDGQPVDTPRRRVRRAPPQPSTVRRSPTRCAARRTPQFFRVKLSPIPQGNRPLYFILAAIGIFTLLVGTAVRLRRPRDPATLHFFWLCLAFFGRFTFSFSGRLDRLDWFFYWADVVSRSWSCRRCSCTSRWSSPNARLGPTAPSRARSSPLMYLPAVLSRRGPHRRASRGAGGHVARSLA